MPSKYKLIIFDVSGTLCGGFGHLYDGVMDTFEFLQSKGYKIALATNLSRSGLLHFVENHRLKNHLSSYVSATEISFKPDPEMLELVLLESDCEKREALMVGDTASDIHMAKNAGVDSCAVSWDKYWSPELLNAGPTYTVETWQKFREILENA